MSTLTGNKISLTYKSLIKTSDNDVLTGALKELSDGLGNNSGVFLNTGGDLKSTGTLEFSNFKATAYAVTINKLVNEADGISNNDNDTSLPTSAAVKDYVDTHVTSQDLDFSDGTNVGAVDLDSQVFAIVGTSNEIETSASGQQLQIGLPNDVTISGTFFATEFQGAFAGTINSGTTAVTQTAGDNSTKVATTAYVDTLDAASDLDFSDGSVSSAVNLNTQVFSIQGTSNEITTTASGQSLTIALDSTGVDLPDGSTAITQTAGDNSTKVATTAYVDTLDAASDLDIAGDTGTGDVNLNTQTLTLQGTTNQVITAVSGQTTTFSLPSTVHRDLQGNVTGNADTATAWQTARDLSISGEATGTLSSVDGTGNVSGAVTLTNSAVTGKVLTGLPTPAAATVQPSDSILEGIGKLQSQINGIANGLQFQGTWDAATNTPTLNSGGGEVDSGTTTGQTADKLIDSSQNFLTTVSVGDKVINQVDGQSALVTNVDSNTSLTLDADIMLSGEAYTIDASPFLVQGHYYVVSVGGTTSLNGNANWAVGDWVIAGADNVWSKLDHTQIDGQGTPGNLPVWNTATTLTDSIVSEIGTALIVTGSLTTTLGASITGDFVVNTNKFTVSSTTGNVAFPGDLVINTNKFSVSGTTGNTLVAGTLDVTGKSTFGDDITISDSTPILDFEDTDNTDNNWRMEARGSFGGFFFQSFDNNFQTGSTVLFAKYSNGYIGLGGNTNPQAELDITGGLITSGNATFGGGITSTYANVSGGVNGGYFRTAAANTDYNLITRDATGNALFVQSAQSNANQPIANFRYGSSSVNQGTPVLQVSKDNSHFVNCNVGIGTDTPDAKLDVNGGINSTHALFSGQDGRGLKLSTENTLNNDDGVVYDAQTSTGKHLFKTNGTERMRIDSAGIVRIFTTGGTSEKTYSAAAGLELYSQQSDASVPYTKTSDIVANGDGTVPSQLRMFTKASGSSTPAERMRIDSNGDVQFNGSTVISSNTSDGSDNAVISLAGGGANSDGRGARIRLYGNEHASLAGVVDLSTGNIAGADMYLSAKDVMYFYTGDTEHLQITNADYGQIKVKAKAGTNGQPAILRLEGTNSSAFGGSIIADSSIESITDGNAYGANLLFRVNDTSNVLQERMRITSGGNVNVGVPESGASSITGPFVVTHGSTRFMTASYEDSMVSINSKNNNNTLENLRLAGASVVFYSGSGTTGSERMRITSAGIIEAVADISSYTNSQTVFAGYGDTDSGEYGIALNTAGDGLTGSIASNLKYSNGTITQLNTARSSGEIKFSNTTTASETATISFGGYYKGTTSFVERMSITSDGSLKVPSVHSQTTGIGANVVVLSDGELLRSTSSLKYKTDVRDYDKGLNEVMQLQPKYYKGKNDESETQFAGLIAEDVHDLGLTEFVQYADDGSPDALSYTHMIALLTKSIQELKAEVDKLKQECKCK